MRRGRTRQTCANGEECESDQDYVPLNDGFAWKGDPNATLSGKASHSSKIHLHLLDTCRSGAAPPLRWRSTTATGTYVGPGRAHLHTIHLAETADKEQTWQAMLLPPPGLNEQANERRRTKS